MDIIIKIKQLRIETIKRYRNVNSIVYDKSKEKLVIQSVSKNKGFYDTESYNYTIDYEIIKVSREEWCHDFKDK